MTGIKMLHEDEGHAGVLRQMIQQLRERFQSAGGRADADDGKRISARQPALRQAQSQAISIPWNSLMQNSFDGINSDTNDISCEKKFIWTPALRRKKFRHRQQSRRAFANHFQADQQGHRQQRADHAPQPRKKNESQENNGLVYPETLSQCERRHEITSRQMQCQINGHGQQDSINVSKANNPAAPTTTIPAVVGPKKGKNSKLPPSRPTWRRRAFPQAKKLTLRRNPDRRLSS